MSGIRWNWDVESDDGWQQVAEDPEAIAERRRRFRRTRNISIALLCVMALLAGLAIHRLREVNKQIRANLEATVAVETLALRMGDRETFLAVQKDTGLWRSYQEFAFEEYRTTGARLDISGEIVELEIRRNLARVTLREVLDGQPYRVTWFYEHGDTGWMRIPPHPDLLGERRHDRTTFFDLHYYEEDQILADALVGQLTDVWITLCNLANCGDIGLPPRLTVQISPEPHAMFDWTLYSPDQTLHVPSSLLGRVPEGGLDTLELPGKLIEQFAFYWVDHVFEDELPVNRSSYGSAETMWLKTELRTWLLHEIDRLSPSSVFMEDLVVTYGQDDVLAFLQAANRDGAMYPALEKLTGQPASELPTGVEDYITFLLQYECPAPPTENITCWPSRDPERDEQPAILLPPTAVQAIQETIDVIGIRDTGDLVWAEVQSTPIDNRGGPPGDIVTYEPFRIVGDHLVHTWPYREDWGELREEHGEYVTLRYHELDAPFVEGLLGYLEMVYDDYVNTISIALEQPAVLVSVNPFIDGSLFSADEFPPRFVNVVLRSPYVSARPAADTPQEHLWAVAYFKLHDHLNTYYIGTTGR